MSQKLLEALNDFTTYSTNVDKSKELVFRMISIAEEIKRTHTSIPALVLLAELKGIISASVMCHTKSDYEFLVTKLTEEVENAMRRVVEDRKS